MAVFEHPMENEVNKIRAPRFYHFILSLTRRLMITFAGIYKKILKFL